MPRVFPDALLDHCAELYRAKIPAAEISRQTGVSKSAIHRLIKARGIPGIRLINLPDKMICAEYLAGDSPAVLADRYGVSVMPIIRVLKRSGIALRSGSEANLIRAARLTPEQRKANAEAAHAAKRGRVNSFDALCRAAKTRQDRGVTRTSDFERKLAEMLIQSGVDVTPQVAIGPYNCDIGAFPVAVEVFGGKWHWHGAHLARSSQRLRYILESGWHILAVRISSNEDRLTDDTVRNVIAFIDQARGDPSSARQYRVVRSNGDLIASGSSEDDDFSIVSAFKNARDPATGRYVRVPK